VRGVVEREEDGLLRSRAGKMPVGGAEGRWRGRRSGECSRRGGAGARQSVVAEAARACGASS
jgi:hypothetical protein